MENQQPTSKVTIQTIAMPSDANPNGDIFGGWIMSQMDLAGGLVAAQRAKGRVVTVAIDSMVFHKPVRIGDVVSCYAKIVNVGTTSIAIKIATWITNIDSQDNIKVTEGLFTYVAIDDQGKKRAVKIL